MNNTFTPTCEILDRLNDWEEKHYADPESVWDIWQEVILELPDYDGEATAASVSFMASFCDRSPEASTTNCVISIL